jgi:hypothetical protein
MHDAGLFHRYSGFFMQIIQAKFEKHTRKDITNTTGIIYKLFDT